jgi:hypothetical protein
MRTALALAPPLLVVAPACYGPNDQARDNAELRQQILELIRQEQQRERKLRCVRSPASRRSERRDTRGEAVSRILLRRAIQSQ